MSTTVTEYQNTLLYYLSIDCHEFKNGIKNRDKHYLTIGRWIKEFYQHKIPKEVAAKQLLQKVNQAFISRMQQLSA